MSALDPIAHGHTAAEEAMKKLAEYFPTLIGPEREEQFTSEVRQYHLCQNLSPSDEVQLDHWWNNVMKEIEIPTLSSVVKACLSIFCAPAVEQSFSMMNHITTAKTNRLDITTYAAHQGIKYHPLARKISSIEMFRRTDIVFSPVDKAMVFHIQTARRRAMMNTSQGPRAKKTTAHKKAEEQIAAITNNNKKRAAEDISLLDPPAPKRLK